MNYIFIIFCSIILPTFLANQIAPKLCIDCKFYRNRNFLVGSEFGKCSLFPKEEDNDNFLVNGNKNKSSKDYRYCSVLRKYDHLCGEKGKYFEKIK